MSAEPLAEERAARRPRLSLVSAPTATVSTLGFVGIIVALIGLGLGGVMIVTTSVGAQSRELSSLRNEATQLGYQRAALESELQRVSSANALAMRAAELGMVPNPYPAFINLADGSITGEPTAVQGNELPFLRGVRLDPEPSAEPQIVQPETITDPGGDAVSGDISGDVVAAGSTDDQQGEGQQGEEQQGGNESSEEQQ